MHNNFIHTKDKETSETLRELGFQLLTENGDGYTFVNPPSSTFNLETFKDLKCITNNKLTF
jgi:hypothetical protein